MFGFYRVTAKGFGNFQAYAWLTPAMIYDPGEKEVIVWFDHDGQMIDMPYSLKELEILGEL
jgi:hypothetical protein